MVGRLSGKVAFVTGAGQGIGRGVALALAKEGASVALVGRTLGKLEHVMGEIKGVGGAAGAIPCDVSSRSEVDNAIAATVSAFGRLDIVINNAQSSVQRLLEETTDADVALCYSTGSLGTLYAMQAALPHLKRQGGSIVNFASSTGVTGEQTFAAYAMAKEAIRGLTRVASREWGPYKIRVNCVCPTALTPASEAWFKANPEAYDATVGTIPLRRLGDPEQDIGRAIAALCTDDLSYITGATLMLGGGRTLLG